MTFAEFIREKVRRGEIRKATPEELRERRDCHDIWHTVLWRRWRTGKCPRCGQRLKGWLYEVTIT